MLEFLNPDKKDETFRDDSFDISIAINGGDVNFEAFVASLESSLNRMAKTKAREMFIDKPLNDLNDLVESVRERLEGNLERRYRELEEGKV